MTDSMAISNAQARKALETFITDNPELERLEGLLAQFNIFEALGAVRHEVRHSDFLAFLLNPQGKHGLGDAFIKRFLQTSITSAGRTDLPVKLVDLNSWSLDAVIVQREWQRIDIFLRDEVHQFSVIIENKIDTGEHDDQLARYYESVRREFPNDRILALYLTKGGDDPSDDRYVPIGYEPVCEAIENLIEHLIEHHASTLVPDVRTLMMHYAQMLRRHILNDTDIARLCRSIYQEHKVALDLIYEHRPNRQAEFTVLLEALVDSYPGLVKWNKYNRKRYVVFYCSEWSIIQPMLYLVFINIPEEGLVLNLTVGPGKECIRRTLYELAPKHQPPFNYTPEQFVNYFNIYRRRILTVAEYDEGECVELENKIRDGWEQFLLQDLPAIRQVLVDNGWISASAESEKQPLSTISVS